ncbi:MAG: hypothetical protein MJ249_10275 [Kiritimatiellae bacterium]|nr:hypothetical protein [Kiritimatiellia bacterium]
MSTNSVKSAPGQAPVIGNQTSSRGQKSSATQQPTATATNAVQSIMQPTQPATDLRLNQSSFSALDLTAVLLGVAVLGAVGVMSFLMLKKLKLALRWLLHISREQIDKGLKKDSQDVQSLLNSLSGRIVEEMVPSFIAKVAPGMAKQVGEQVRAAVQPQAQAVGELKGEIQAMIAKVNSNSEYLEQYLQDVDSTRQGIEELRARVEVAIAKMEEPVALREENCSLKAQLGNAGAEKEALKRELDGRNQELADSKRKIAELEGSLVTKDAAHQKEIADLMVSQKAALQAKGDEAKAALQAKESECEKTLQQLRDGIASFAPSDILKIFDFDLAHAEEDPKGRMLVQSYLSLIGGSVRERDFPARFDYFDRTLFEALRDDGERLAVCRGKIVRHLNPLLQEHAGGLQVAWAEPGSQFDSAFWNAESDSGTSVECASRAMIYRMDAVSGRVCVIKGRVITC